MNDQNPLKTMYSKTKAKNNKVPKLIKIYQLFHPKHLNYQNPTLKFTYTNTHIKRGIFIYHWWGERASVFSSTSVLRMRKWRRWRGRGRVKIEIGACSVKGFQGFARKVWWRRGREGSGGSGQRQQQPRSHSFSLLSSQLRNSEILFPFLLGQLFFFLSF